MRILDLEKALKTKKRIFIDMDGVIANIIDKWILYYNDMYQDNLKLEDIKSWDLTKAVKPEAQATCNAIFKIPGFYKDLDVIGNSQQVVKKLMKLDYEIFILTDPFSKFSLECKWEWLQEHFPFINTRHYIFTGNKSIAGDGFLIDDGIHNLDVFEGYGLLFYSPYNKDISNYNYVNNWNEILAFFEELESYKEEVVKKRHS